MRIQKLRAGYRSSMTRRHSRTRLEQHHPINRARPAADPSLADCQPTQCVSCGCPGQISREASLRPPLQVGPAVARRRHWSTMTPSPGPALLQARPRYCGETPRASGMSVRDGTVVQTHCGHRSKSGHQSLAGATGAP